MDPTDMAAWPTVGWVSGWIFAAVMVATFFRMLARGTLRTGREVEELRRDRDARVADAAARTADAVAQALVWKAANDVKDEVIRELTRQNSRMLSLSETSAHALTSFIPPGARDKEGGEEDVHPSTPSV